MDGHPVIAVGATVAAALATALALVPAWSIADALATREPVTFAPLGEWWRRVAARPRIAALAAAAAAAMALRWAAAPLAAVAMLTAVGVAALAAMVDVRCHRLPDVLVGPLALGLVAVVGMSAAVRSEPQRLGSALLAGVVAGLLLGVGWLVGMGLGDVKFGAALGVLVGWPVGSSEGAVLAALAVIGGAASAASLWWAARRLLGGGADRWFPFGPFLAGAAILLVFAIGPPTSPAAGDLADSPAGRQAGTGSPCAPGPPVDSGVCSAS